MAENDENTKPQSVSIEDYNSLKAKCDKLEKIFEERQTKTLDKEGILKILGIEKAPEKPIAEVLGEKINSLNVAVESLQAENKAKDEKLAMNEKKQKVRDLAKPYNFIDVGDVLAVIDYSNDDIEGQLKTIAESKKHWIKGKDLGGSFSGTNGNPPSQPKTAFDESKVKHSFQKFR